MEYIHGVRPFYTKLSVNHELNYTEISIRKLYFESKIVNVLKI